MTVNYLLTAVQAKEVGPPWIFRPACCRQEDTPVKGFNLQIPAAAHHQGRKCFWPGKLSLTAPAQFIISKGSSRLQGLLDRPILRYASGALSTLLPRCSLAEPLGGNSSRPLTTTGHTTMMFRQSTPALGWSLKKNWIETLMFHFMKLWKGSYTVWRDIRLKGTT